MDRSYIGKLEKITKVSTDRGTGETLTHIILISGKMHTSIIFHGNIHSDVIGHRVKYSRAYREKVLVKERLVDLRTKRQYVAFFEM